MSIRRVFGKYSPICQALFRASGSQLGDDCVPQGTMGNVCKTYLSVHLGEQWRGGATNSSWVEAKVAAKQPAMPRVL